MYSLQDQFQFILDNPLPSLAVIGNLILIESLLSIDNAAVLATMVMDLPKKERERALKYGIFGAYIFRGLALLFATWLIKIWWLKTLGGAYLLYLAINWWVEKRKPVKHHDDVIDKKKNWFYTHIVGWLGNFWATVAVVEIMDLAFSIDNVFAAVAFTDNVILIWLGVFIGILAMRFVAQGFVKLMEHYPFLETSAFVVIGVLGIKLTLSLYEHFYENSRVSEILTSSNADVGISIITVLIFLVPMVTSVLFNFPKKHFENDKKQNNETE
ncbi:MAG: TerC family protein [Bacteroidia bacterium]|nr:TerC family protein [Bacteroidia bacterium]